MSTGSKRNFTDLLELSAKKLPAFAGWRQPGESTQYLMLAKSVTKLSNPQVEKLPAGFLIGPYGHPEDDSLPKEAYFLASKIYLNSEDERNWVEGFEYLKGLPAGSIETDKTTLQPPNPTNKSHFIKWVELAIEEIKLDRLQKVVAARTIIEDLPTGFSIAEFFNLLCSSYPQAFVSLIYIPGFGMWVGATPEVLIKQSPAGVFKTMALAGTQLRTEGLQSADAVWRQKDIEEQALVSRYIINCFKQIRLREFSEVGPRTVAAANLLHLRTDFLVDTLATQRPDLASKMLELLHPTSAVCGMPLQVAARFISQHEGFDRDLYAGYLGPVNFQAGEIDLYVNLRCLQITGGKAVIYAGAGLTGDSDPEREWQETEAKSRTLLDILYKQN